MAHEAVVRKRTISPASTRAHVTGRLFDLVANGLVKFEPEFRHAA